MAGKGHEEVDLCPHCGAEMVERIFTEGEKICINIHCPGELELTAKKPHLLH